MTRLVAELNFHNGGQRLYYINVSCYKISLLNEPVLGV
jgi:hypothetical protein